MQLILGDLKYGIIDGKLNSNVSAIGSCTGTQSGTYACSGKNKYIKWSLDLGKSDFEIRSEFKVDRVDGTVVSFVLWSGPAMFHIGLDGGGKRLFYEGGTWRGARHVGATNLKANTFQTIIIKRAGEQLNVTFDGEEWNPLPISASIDAVGWRPWRNTIHIKDLHQRFDSGTLKNRITLID